ncbi:MAG: putative zinc-binding protein [Anaerolineaceae bacterium]
MPEIPQKKVGIIACSGEELPEGTVTRLAALQVLEKLRPSDTVTICLPLFLAGGEGDRAFAKFYPTIAIDGCEKRCAYRGTEQYSNSPAFGIVVTDLIKEHGLETPSGTRKLNTAGMQAVEHTAKLAASKVDELLGKAWSRREGEFAEEPAKNESVATCSCGSGIPVQKVQVNGQEMTIVALPLIFDNFTQSGKVPGIDVAHEIMAQVKIYNAIDPSIEMALETVLLDEYTQFYRQQKEIA